MVVKVELKAVGSAAIIVESTVRNIKRRGVKWAPYRSYATREEAEQFIAQHGSTTFRIAEPGINKTGRAKFMKVTNR